MSEAAIHLGDCRTVLPGLPAASVNCCVTSPPYWGLRDYGVPEQLGLEPTPSEYVAALVGVFGEVRRVLRDDGTLWLNLGDCYAHGEFGRNDAPNKNKSLALNQPVRTQRKTQCRSGLKSKDLVGIPWMVAFALRADGWYLRQDIIWSKPNPMPESVTDRCTKAHECIFLMSKSARYYFDAEAIQEKAVSTGGGASFGKQNHDTNGTGAQSRQYDRPTYETRNRRSVWTVATRSYNGAHFATFPPKLIEPCILAGCPKGGTVLDPFAGTSTTGQVAIANGRSYVGIELNPEYIELSRKRLVHNQLALI